MHKICVSIKRPGLLNMVTSNLALNQQVYIEGKLSTKQFKTNDGRNRQTTAILASEVCIFSDMIANNIAENHLNDENSVELLGTITTKITGTNFKSFTLAALK